MKRILIIVIALISLGCNNNSPKISDLIGRWHSSDGAIIEFKSDGTFYGLSLSNNYFLDVDQEVENKKFDGSGKWKLSKSKGFIEIKLKFIQISNMKRIFDTQIYVSGSNGIMENRPPWYLFEWKGEEGGERYIFRK